MKKLDTGRREAIFIAGRPAPGMSEHETVTLLAVAAGEMRGTPPARWYVLVRDESDALRSVWQSYEWLPRARGLLDPVAMGGGFKTRAEAAGWMARVLPAFEEATDAPTFVIGRDGRISAGQGVLRMLDEGGE